MNRIWLLTSTTYGTWLPGDARGSVTRVRDGDGARIEHDRPQTPYIEEASGLSRSAGENLSGPPIFLNAEQARAVSDQFRETSKYRGWSILACAVMSNHFHILVGMAGDPEPSDLLRDFKSYASRRLNRCWGKPASETWWTAKGSMRKKAIWPAIACTVEYVRDQVKPFVVWVDEEVVATARTLFET